MAKYRKKPVVIEAVPTSEVIAQMKSNWMGLPKWVREAYEAGVIVAIRETDLTIKTLEGDHLALRDDMIIRGVKGELYPCRKDIFLMTYEEV